MKFRHVLVKELPLIGLSSLGIFNSKRSVYLIEMVLANFRIYERWLSADSLISPFLQELTKISEFTDYR